MLPLSPNQLVHRALQCLQIDDPHALDEVIPLYYDALGYYNTMHACRGQLLCSLGMMLCIRFKRQGNDKDLDQGIALQSEVLALRPVGHTYWSNSLNNLATQLSTHFHHRGNDEDLDQAIALHREALTLCPVGHTGRQLSAIALQREALALLPVGHTDRSSSLSHLAIQLSIRFDHRGNGEDLDQAIELQREALVLCPVSHTVRSVSLSNLAARLFTRFHHRGNDKDLDQAIALHREALALCPVSHTDWSSSLGSLANGLSTRFDHRGNGEDLDEAIALHREALALLPVSHTDRSIQLSTCFHHRGNDEDLNQAIAFQREALALCPSLGSLVNELSIRFHHRGDDEDLNQAIALQREVLALCPLLNNFHRGNGDADSLLNAAMDHLKAAANIISGGLLHRLRASLRLIHHASQHSHGTELEAYATFMRTLTCLTLAVNAASCALRSGDVCRAVELLEQGRTLIWTQMTRLRTPLDSLQTRGDHAVALMKRFRDLSSLLGKPPASHLEGTPRVDVEAEATRYRRLVEDWNRAVEEIRKIEDFSRFLLPPMFSDLQDAARDGPIIVLIASKSSCDAIIIPHKQPPTSIQLSTNLEKLQMLVIKFQRTSSRIWWCPTSLFNFLPLHAAGKYRRHGQFLSQLHISSYMPSLTALIKARRQDRSLSVSFAAIGQNLPAGASFTLDCVESELELVQSLLPPPPTVSFTKIMSVDAMRSMALCALRDHTWLHFLCHRTQNYEDPFNSALLMRDQPLSLLDITQTDLSRHEFAFLSACETAVGDHDTPDEAIHLVAGLQFAGVKSIVGTLWKVNDSTVQRLVEAFYKNFCGDGTMNSKRAAQVLHRAVQLLASDMDMPLDQRIVFIHIGI
ncbi:CHAT domain-containing protein [Suillus subalutaceus]|uniref:CHAT domain-containing protein n=1 Tax=Suillus subalutaceus TaxID=48586 RepID=UPI001B87C581|nr:CHAT domain-containing protein [Suillus subalutaceus]KAG1870207.1 CHAT domain-containing protein [Suillus subalutaceus]